MARASDDALSELHNQLAKLLQESLAKEFRDAEGKLLPPSPALLNVARQFLKDNHIETGVGTKTGPLQGLAGLPVFDDENVIPFKQNG